MKKFKHLIPFLLALIIAIAIPVAGCDSCGSKKELTLQSISINTDNAKTLFAVGEEFTAEGIVVTAALGSETKINKEVTLTAEDYVVDSSAYKKDVEGTYTIKVTYTNENVTKDSTYNVSVKTLLDGLNVTLAEGTPDTYTLTAEQPTAEIDTSKIVVKEINRDGTVGNETTGYSVKLYKGQEEITLTNGKATVGGGAYAIWVEKPSEAVSDFNLTAFVLVYVNDTITGFDLKEGTFEQTVGEDVMSDTWVFTATYASGATKEIKGEDCQFTLDTMTVAKNVPLTITYTDVNAKGDEIDKSYETTYTINMVYGTTTYTYDFDAIDYSEMGGDSTALKQSDLTGVNTFLKLGGGTAVYRNKDVWNTGANVIEIKNVGFQVTFYGTGTIKIGFASTGSTNWSSVGLRDASGNYVSATYDTSNANIKEDDAQENTYLVYGTTAYELTFTVTKPGTYSIVAAINSSYNRNARMHSVVLVDNVDDPAKIICDVDFSDLTAGNLATNKDTAPVQIKDNSGEFVGVSVTKSSSSLNANKIVAVGGKNVLQLQQTATVEQNSLVFTVPSSGKIQITVRYSFTSAGRYLDIFDADGVLASSSDKPTVVGETIEYVVTLDVDADATIYLGSHSGQINIEYLKIEKV